MRNTGMKAVYSLFQKGYCFGDLVSIYYIAVKDKKMSKFNITEEYLLSELENMKNNEKKTIDRDEYNLYYSKRYDFTHYEYGVVYPLSKIDNDGTVLIIDSNQNIHRVYYQMLIPIKEPSKLYRLMFQAVVPKYYSKTGKIDREGIYDLLRIYGEDQDFLNELGIYLNPMYDSEDLNEDELQEEKKTLKDNDEHIKNDPEINSKPKYISVDGRFTEEEVDLLVKKLDEDLYLLELVGIIPNPDSLNNSNKTYKK